MPKQKPEMSSKRLYCSFCGKSQLEVAKLIAGPDVFMCDECLGVSLDVIIDGEKDGRAYLKEFLSKTKLDKYVDFPHPNAILREINFPPEYRQACITILANFSNLIRSKYEDEDIQVSIKQDGDKLILIIEGPDGIREKVEETMHSYSLVLQGVTEPETLTTNPYVLMDLRQQLRIAQLQLENQKDLFALEQKHSAQLISASKDRENVFQDMVLRLSSVLDSNKDDKRLYQLLVESLINVNSSLAKDSVSQLIKVVQEGSQTRSDQDITNALITLRDEEPGVFERVKKFLEGCGQELVGNGLYSWLSTLIISLPVKG